MVYHIGQRYVRRFLADVLRIIRSFNGAARALLIIASIRRHLLDDSMVEAGGSRNVAIVPSY